MATSLTIKGSLSTWLGQGLYEARASLHCESGRFHSNRQYRQGCFFVAQVDFVGGTSYTADLARLKNVALADNQQTGQTTSQVPAQ
jgi:hypothetical protein